MKKFLQKLMMAGVASAVILGCSAEDGGEEQMSSLDAVGTTTNLQVTEITMNDLLGTWKLESMTSVEIPVNLDGNSTESTDILAETSCFHNMYFTFEPEGVVKTRQARLSFDETGFFTCDEKDYSATYSVSGNNLAITFLVKGISYTENREITIENDGTNDFLKMSLTGIETDAAVYVEDGRQNTVAKNIVQIDFVYVKK